MFKQRFLFFLFMLGFNFKLQWALGGFGLSIVKCYRCTHIAISVMIFSQFYKI